MDTLIIIIIIIIIKRNTSNTTTKQSSVECTMYQDVDMLNTVKSVLADISSVRPSSEQRAKFCGLSVEADLPFRGTIWSGDNPHTCRSQSIFLKETT